MNLKNNMMNKIYTLILVIGITIITSCVRDPSKDDVHTNNTTNEPYVATTISLVDSVGRNQIYRKDAAANIIVTAGAEVIVNNPDVFNDLIPTALSEGSIVTYTATVIDSKLTVATASIIYVVVRGNEVLISNEIELGAQLNTTSLPSFLGLVNNFTYYFPGTSGTAQAFSYYIDFVYFYDPIDKNSFASPTNPNAQIIWGTEISTWPRINETKFKVTSINATDFDKIKNLSKVDDSFYNIDFLNGSTDNVTNFSVNDVVAFQNSVGKVGLIKFTQTANAEDGSMKLQIICQK